MYCPKCGKLNKEGARFCAFCGEKLELAEKNNKETKKKFSLKNINLNKKVSIIGLILFGFILVFGFGLLKNTNLSTEKSPAETVRVFIKTFEKGEYSKAKDYVFSQSWNFWDLHSFDTEREKIMRKGGIKKINIIEEEIEGNYAQVHWTLEYKNGEQESSWFYLVKEGDVWKISE